MAVVQIGEQAGLSGFPAEGWQECESFANRLTQLLPALSAAASLAGIANADTDPVLQPLVCDPGQAHRRRVWEAFGCRSGRCGRWIALHRLGIPIRAYPANRLDSFKSYREPKEIEIRQTPAPGQPVGFYEVTQHDPEDSDYRPPPIEPKTMIPGRRMFAR